MTIDLLKSCLKKTESTSQKCTITIKNHNQKCKELELPN